MRLPVGWWTAKCAPPKGQKSKISSSLRSEPDEPVRSIFSRFGGWSVSRFFSIKGSVAVLTGHSIGRSERLSAFLAKFRNLDTKTPISEPDQAVRPKVTQIPKAGLKPDPWVRTQPQPTFSSTRKAADSVSGFGPFSPPQTPTRDPQSPPFGPHAEPVRAHCT